MAEGILVLKQPPAPVPLAVTLSHEAPRVFVSSSANVHLQMASPLVCWLRICLPMPAARLQSLLREDSTRSRAANHGCHDC